MTKPSENEVEITLLGTGGGYGESLVVKIGKSSWIVIDSCINPNTKVPLAIEYFNEIGVNYQEEVIRIICTHWHDDHIRGISQLLDECKTAMFCVPTISSTRHFMIFVGYDDLINSKQPVISTSEFKSCIEILKERPNPYPRRISSDITIYTENVDGVDFGVYALSPSNQVVSKFDFELAELIKEVKDLKKSIVHKKPNDKSLATLIKFGDQRIILGADLEIGNDPNEGWLDILNNSEVTDPTRANLFKIPHHGSSNGYDVRIFDKLIGENSILKLTPWNLGSKLPTKEMIEVYNSHSTELYITSKATLGKGKQKPREKSMEKLIEFANKTVKEEKFSKGIITSRYNYVLKEGWKTNTYYSATKL